MKILIIASGCIAIDAFSLQQRPLGGIETGVIRLAESLHALGNEVIVASNSPNPPLSDPLFIPFSGLPLVGETDVLIVVREWTPFLLNLPAKINCFWTGDSYDQPQSIGFGDGRLVEKIDLLFCVSEWHRQTLCKASGFPLNKARVLRNGIHPAYFEGEEIRHPKRLIYSSTPYRGLKYLPGIFKSLISHHPDAELVVCSGYKVYEGAGPYPKEALDELEQLKLELSSIPGCDFRGNITQEALAREFMSSSILAYPNIFEETSCISVLEAKAAGCIPVTSARAALPETVGNGGICIAGEPGSEVYTKAFVDAIDSIFTSAEKRERLQRNCLEESKNDSWDTRARELVHILENAQST